MKKEILADTLAIPFWIILIIWSINQLKLGNSSALLVLIIITIALIVDSYLVINYKRHKK